MAVLDIDGQPVPDVIGGMKDLTSIIHQVNGNFTSVQKADVGEGQTSPEQGRDYFANLVTKAETLTADTLGKNFTKSVPWLALGALVLVYYFIARRTS